MIYLFAGPTISHDEIKQHIDCVCLPPVCHGDILQVLGATPRPTVIGIIDGYFEGAPSVWHKEILYALDQGVHVFGSSSMGALRAAELHTFGMVGVGQIFQWYKEELIDADDEVAVLHGPAEVEYMAASEPLVNIRATLAAAAQQGKISCEQTKVLLENARATYYKKRSWSVFLSLCAEFMGETWQTAGLQDWFELNRVDLKKQDALELLDVIAQHRKSNSAVFQSDFHFENTNVWNVAVDKYQRRSSESSQLNESQQFVLDQLKLEPDRYERYRHMALITWLADNRLEIHSDELDLNLKRALQQFRTNNALTTRSQLMDSLDKMELNEKHLVEILVAAGRAGIARVAAGNVQSIIIQLLKLEGVYLTLLEAHHHKREALTTAGIKTHSLTVLPPQVLAWYFRTQLGTALPANIDAHLKKIDVKNTEEFYRLITAEYIYCAQGCSVNTVE